ncbi:hypothetical protein RIF29_17257 [Crotalaria pallida]|uniref:Secreted protein n=1 Tax=Crotalaria pallida TaxID=3830 RepID=A0AAN9FI34_CROPI
MCRALHYIALLLQCMLSLFSSLHALSLPLCTFTTHSVQAPHSSSSQLTDREEGKLLSKGEICFCQLIYLLSFN